MASRESLNLTSLFYKKSETRTRSEITEEIQDSIENSEIIKSKVAYEDVKDNLISTDTNKPLSANQGKVLKGLVDSKANNTRVDSLESSLNGQIQEVAGDVSDIETALTTKVDKVNGMGLSSNDYTSNEKTKLAGIETGANRTIVDAELKPNSTNPVQNKVICEQFYDKAAIVDLLNNIQTSAGKLLTIYIDEETGDLVVDDDSYHYYTSDEVDENFTIDVQKQTIPEAGFFATYVIKQGGNVVGTKINIPKDYLLQSASINTASADISGTDIKAGDKYFDFVFNTKDSSTSDAHMYLNAKDLVDTYGADETTLTMNSNNIFSIKSVPVSLINGVLPANQVTHQDITGKEDKTNKVSSWNTTPNNTRYPSEKLVKDSLDGKSDSGHTHSYDSLTGKPSTFTPSSHNHSIGEVTNLQSTLNGKSNNGHTHRRAEITDFSHTHTKEEISNFPSTMPPSAHNHSIGEVTNLQSTLNSKMNSSDYDTVALAVVFEDGTSSSYDLVYHKTS